jgi:hypothetical protein
MGGLRRQPLQPGAEVEHVRLLGVGDAERDDAVVERQAATVGVVERHPGHPELAAQFAHQFLGVCSVHGFLDRPEMAKRGENARRAG